MKLIKIYIMLLIILIILSSCAINRKCHSGKCYTGKAVPNPKYKVPEKLKRFSSHR